MTHFVETFADETAYNDFKGSSEYVTPNVSVCSGGGGSIFYNPLEKHDYSKDYFTLVALEDGKFKITSDRCGASQVESHYYSIDNGQTWTELPIGTDTPTISAGNKVLWKNNMPTGYMVGTFESTCNFDAQGNVMSLVYGDNFANQASLQGYNYALRGLFGDSNIKKANNLSLPATTLAINCYVAMFNGCTSLETAPELPATTLAQYCYSYMFYACTGLKTAPELPATTLNNYCYSSMFQGCTSLKSITCLATDISASNCTTNWVSGVAASGTFTKAASMTNWTTGVNGIPTGWSIVDK